MREPAVHALPHGLFLHVECDDSTTLLYPTSVMNALVGIKDADILHYKGESVNALDEVDRLKRMNELQYAEIVRLSAKLAEATTSSAETQPTKPRPRKRGRHANRR